MPYLTKVTSSRGWRPGGLSYFLDESTGYGLEFSYIINSDKEERKCIENFYNKPDPNDSVTGVCASTGDPAEAKAAFQNADGESYEPSMGPAYPPIRQLDYLISGYWVWNPVYGKQLFFMSGVAHFDVFIKVGGGVAMSQLFPLKTSASDGTPYRGTLPPCEGTLIVAHCQAFRVSLSKELVNMGLTADPNRSRNYAHVHTRSRAKVSPC